jgi:hypothetical protein
VIRPAIDNPASIAYPRVPGHCDDDDIPGGDTTGGDGTGGDCTHGDPTTGDGPCGPDGEGCETGDTFTTDLPIPQ